jgi:NAD(P)H-hydrate epimerase
MKIFTNKQIREADKATIERQSISSLELMERAARGIAEWISENVDPEQQLLFCCGRGGNGGDGLAVARILADAGRKCTVLLGANPTTLSEESRANFARLPKRVKVLNSTLQTPDIESDTVIIDALLGVGVTDELREPIRGIVEWINSQPNRVISIDLPSGLPTEWGSGDKVSDWNAAKIAVRADTTLTIGFPKLSLLFRKTGQCAGNVIVIPIELDKNFIAATTTPYYYITQEWVDRLRKPRVKFSHKGDYGHSLLVCGSETMPGAAILATSGALRSGCGLVTSHVPKNEKVALAANCPPALLSLDEEGYFSASFDRLERFSAIGIGPGLGRNEKTINALKQLLEAVSAFNERKKICAECLAKIGFEPQPQPQPQFSLSSPATPASTSTNRAREARKIRMVLDADALNIISENADFKQFIPADSVLTPHPGELQRLVGKWVDDREKLEKASNLAVETASVVIVKDAHSVICTPDGRFIFNSTGTPGMAKGGSGDVLTGFVAGLLARGYDAETASVIGVYNHGRAGEKAAEVYGEEAMNASDLAEFL